MPAPLQDQVVAITGASSGIGRATAIELGRYGAAVVLAARNEEALHAAAHETEQAGGRVLPVVTDVADWKQVERLADAAVQHFGRIDTWINNAGVIEYATVEDTTPDEAERILQVNLLGQIHGCRAALSVMKRQESGTIINVSSVEAMFGVPYTAVYSASKHGVHGFTEALRRELILEDSPIQVTEVMPSGIDTPLFDHARSKMGGKKPMPLPPIYPPEAVAEAIVSACEHPQREIVVGGAGKFFILMQRLCPASLDVMLAKTGLARTGQQSDQPNTPGDNLNAPMKAPYQVRGSFGEKTLSSSLFTRLFELHPMLKGAAVGAGVLGVAALMGRLARSTSR